MVAVTHVDTAWFVLCKAAAEDDVEISELTEDDPAVSRRGDGEEVRSRAKSGDA